LQLPSIDIGEVFMVKTCRNHAEDKQATTRAHGSSMLEKRMIEMRPVAPGAGRKLSQNPTAMA
jgi:hypothetical protein